MYLIKLLFIILFCLISLPAYSIFNYNNSRPAYEIIKKYTNLDNVKKIAFLDEPVKSIDMTPYKDFLIDSDYTEIMKLMKEDNLYKTLLKDNPFRIFLYQDDFKNFYAYGKYYINNRNVLFTYSLTGELIKINLIKPQKSPSPVYVYSNEGELIEIILFFYRFKPNGDFIGKINASNKSCNKILYPIYENYNNKISSKDINNLRSNSNTEIIFSQGRINNNKTFNNFYNKTDNDKDILDRIVLSDYPVWITKYPEQLPDAPFYDVNTARKYIMQGDQPPQTIDISKYKDYMIDKDREEALKDIIRGNKKHRFVANDFLIKGFYNFGLFTGYYVKQYDKSNIALYYNIYGELKKIEIRPKETALHVSVKKVPKFPLKSYFYSTDGKLMFICLIVNEFDCYLFKPNGDFFSFWYIGIESNINYYPTGLTDDTFH